MKLTPVHPPLVIVLPFLPEGSVCAKILVLELIQDVLAFLLQTFINPICFPILKAAPKLLVEADVIATLETQYANGSESFVIVGGIDQTIFKNIFLEIFVLFETFGLIGPVHAVQLAVADGVSSDALSTMTSTWNLR